MEKLPSGLADSGALDIAKRLQLISGGKTLDIATQTGGFIKTLMMTFKDYDSFVGIDILFKDLKSMKKEFKTKPVEFITMNAETLEFPDNSFDTVSISHSLHHIFKLDIVFSEMKRVLKPDGYFIIQETFCDGNQSIAQQSDILQHHWSARIDTLLNIPHQNTFKKQEIREIVEKLRLRDQIIFESSHYVKCLFCGNKFECADPKNTDIIQFILKEIDRDLKKLSKLKDHPHYSLLKVEGEEIKERVKKTGSASASNIFVIGKK